MAHLYLTIADLDEAFANPAELELRSALEAAIEQRGIGEIAGGGSGFGEMDLSILVGDVPSAIAALERLLTDFGLSSRANIDEVHEPDQAAEDRDFLRCLGPEVGPAQCRESGCTALRIKNSVLCKLHHFRRVVGRDPIENPAV